MMKISVRGLLVYLLISLGMLQASHDIKIFTSENSDAKITTQTIEEAFKKVGFSIAENRDMNGPFKKQFKETSFDIYNLFTLYKEDIVMELAKKYPNFGLFAPMSMSIYSKKGSSSISIASLSPEAMAKIMKIPAENKELQKLGKLVEEALKIAMPKGKFETISYPVASAKESLVTSFEMELDEEDWDEGKEEFQMTFEGELGVNGFVMAGFSDINYFFEEAKYEEYDFYDVYSICKLPVIYTIAKLRPEAGAYAPCSLYMYKKKGENMMYMAFPSVENWVSSLAVTDKEGLAVLKDAQDRMQKILQEATE